MSQAALDPVEVLFDNGLRERPGPLRSARAAGTGIERRKLRRATLQHQLVQGAEQAQLRH